MLRPSILHYAPEIAAGFQKRAETVSPAPTREKPKAAVNPLLHAAKVIGLTGLGIGLGTGLGIGLERAVGAGYKHISGQDIPESFIAKAAPYVGGGMGLLYGLMRAKHTEEMRRGIPNYGGSESPG